MVQQLQPATVESITVMDGAHVVGIDIGGTNLRLALADSAGAIVARWSASTTGTHSAQSVVALMLKGIDHLLQEAGLSRNTLRAVAVGAPGITNVEEGVIIATSYLLGWRDVPLRDMLETALGVPAAIDNDVNLAAFGESWIGAAQGVQDFVFFAIGTGIGAGIVLHGNLFYGMRWTAGEIGYMLVPGVTLEPGAQDTPGALELLVGGQGIRNQWQKMWDKSKTQLPKDLTATQIFDEALNNGDTLAQAILQQSARAIAYAIYNISLILSCPLFVLGGSVGLHPALVNAIRSILEERNGRALPEIKQSALGADAQLAGAILLALNTAQKRSGCKDISIATDVVAINTSVP